jgi:hypothetical protein
MKFVDTQYVQREKPMRGSLHFLFLKLIQIELKIIRHSTYYHIYKSTALWVVMVSVLASSVVDRGFEPRSSQTKDYIKLVFV